MGIVCLLWRAGVGPRCWLRDLNAFWAMLLLVFLFRAAARDGTVFARLGPLAITAEGLVEGALICLRLWVVALSGVAVSATTRPSHVEAGVRALLAPVPFLPEKRVATMLGLVVRFLPEVLHQAHLTREAQRARCVERRKNPAARMRLFAVPLLRAVFVRANRLALAMEARCYSENRTGPALFAGVKDALAVGVLALFCLLSYL